MNKLLRELEQEAKAICRKGGRYIGVNYQKRTRLERLLFLILKKYCSDQLNYDNLGGLTYTHRELFQEAVTKTKWSKQHIDIVEEGFQIQDLLCDLSSSNPYALLDRAMSDMRAIKKLGIEEVVFGDLESHFLKGLFDRIDNFVRTIRSVYFAKR